MDKIPINASGRYKNVSEKLQNIEIEYDDIENTIKQAERAITSDHL